MSDITITVRNAHHADPDVLGDVLEHVASLCGTDLVTVNIECAPRVPADLPAYRNPGACIYKCAARYAGAGRVEFDAVQRCPDAPTVFY